MTLRTTAKVAGFAYLLYIAAGMANEFFIGRASDAQGIAATLGQLAAHVTDLRLTILFKLLECLSAFVLAATLYGITREQDHELAMLGLVCRAAEGAILAVSIRMNLGLLWLVDHRIGMDAQTTNAVAATLLMPNPPLAAVFFAVGSTIFAALMLRGRMIPAPLAWLGVVSSALLAIAVPLQLAGWASGRVVGAFWVLALVYALVIGVWLIVKGVNPPRTLRA